MRDRILARRHRARPPLSLRANSGLAAVIKELPIGLPEITGSPIRVFVLPQLSAHRGKLLSRSPHCGVPVHAASFIRERRIVLEKQLLRKPRLLRLILVHELFHFVWAQLGNVRRREYTVLIQAEIEKRARGELGESSEVKKSNRPFVGTSAWRDYVCESFCDTAAFLYAGVPRHDAFTLGERWIRRRRDWFQEAFETRRVC